MGIAYFDYALEEPRALDPGLTTNDIGKELDLWAEWQVHDYWSFYFVVARMQPGQVVKQVFDRQSDFKYAMVYLNFAY